MKKHKLTSFYNFFLFLLIVNPNGGLIVPLLFLDNPLQNLEK